MKDNLIPYQWSRKFDDGTIYVVQAETVEELALGKTEIETKLLTSNKPQEQTSEEKEIIQNANKTKYSCNTCGAEANLKEGTSKKGNYYKIMKCSEDEEHDRFIR